MKKRFYHDLSQLLLLEICLLRDPEAARRAWRKWKSRIDFDELDPGSFRIMSLVYRRMTDLGIDDPDAGRIKGIYRYHWTRNQIAWHGKDNIVRKLEAMGIDTLLLKGAALSRTVYPDPTARGMHDLDVLVPISSAELAMQLLVHEGWVAQHFEAIRATIDRFHGCSFVHPEYGELDLHWHVMRSCCRTERDRELWAAARPLTVDGIQTKVLCPADMFLHACEHGMHPSPAAELQWMIDATLIIRNSPEPFDWSRLIDQAKKFRLVLMVRETLRFIREHFEPSIPEEVMRELFAIPVSIRERAAYLLAYCPEENQGSLRRVCVAACHYLNLTEGEHWVDRVFGFPLYYRMLTHEYRPWSVVLKKEAYIMLSRGMDVCTEMVFKAGRFLRQGGLPNGGLISRYRRDRLRNFHEIEWVMWKSFRWSMADAAIELMMPPKPHVFGLALCPYRDLTRLFDDGFVMYVNKHTVPRTAFHWRDGYLFCAIEADWLKQNNWQKISWSIRPLSAPGDSRVLGLPVSRFWTYPGKFGSHAA